MTKPISSFHSRAARVFVSSTFDDMQAEREVLVKRVFPLLRQRFAAQRVVLTEIDLRWGVTSRQQAEGNVLPICLSEIDRCRPYFVGILGSRYGTLVEAIPDEVLQAYPWIAAMRGRSITEVEMEYGALRARLAEPGALFYFRSPDAHAPAAESAAAARALDALKARVRASGASVREGYESAEQLGDFLLEDLGALLDQRFAELSAADPDTHADEAHWFFAERQSSFFVPRQETLDRLERHLASRDPPLLVTGPAGCGKTAVLANWARSLAVRQPDLVVIEHYAGGTPGGASYVALLRRVNRALIRAFDFDERPPIQGRELIAHFADLLERLPESPRVLLVFDGLDQLEDRDGAPDLTFLPIDIPERIRIVASAPPGRAVDAAARRGWRMQSLPPLSLEERSEFVRRYLNEYRKELEPEQAARIAQAKQCEIPLFLRSLLGELRVFGRRLLLDRQIDHYLGALDIHVLLDRILERLEADFDRERRGLVRDVTTALACARFGLAEDELVKILMRSDKSPHRHLLSSILISIEEHLVDVGGLLAPAHEYLRSAIERRYMRPRQLRERVHSALADYFETIDLGPRKIDEYAFHLSEAGRHAALKDFLCDLRAFDAFNSEDGQFKWELQRYWEPLASRYDLVEEYLRSFQASRPKLSLADQRISLLTDLGLFFRLANRLDGAERVDQLALDEATAAFGSDSPKLAVLLNNVAELDLRRYRSAEALPRLRRALEICLAEHGEMHPLTASILDNLGQASPPAESVEYLRRALEIRSRLLGRRDNATLRTMNNLADALMRAGQVEAGMSLARETLSIRERVLGPVHYDTLATLAILSYHLLQRGDYEEAIALGTRAYTGFAKQLGEGHRRTQGAKSNLVVSLLRSRSDLPRAEKLLSELHDSLQRDPAPDGMMRELVRHSLGVLRRAQGQPQCALELVELACRGGEAIAGARAPLVLAFRNTQAELLHELGRSDQAERLFLDVLHAKREQLGSRSLEVARTLHSLASLFADERRYGEASELAREALELRTNLSGTTSPLAAETRALLESIAVY